MGYPPAPWAWADWSYAHGGRFNGRWDSPTGTYRTTDAGSTLLACLVEVLAPFRPDPALLAVTDLIDEDEADHALHPTTPPGYVDRSWFSARRIATASMDGRYCDVTHSQTVATLRPQFLSETVTEYGLEDFDTSAMHNSRPRALTQSVGRALLRAHRPRRLPHLRRGPLPLATRQRPRALGPLRTLHRHRRQRTPHEPHQHATHRRAPRSRKRAAPALPLDRLAPPPRGTANARRASTTWSHVDGFTMAPLSAVEGRREAVRMVEQQTHIVALDLSDPDRHAILVNALQDYANDALDKVQNGSNTAAERDHFQSLASTAHDLIDEVE